MTRTCGGCCRWRRPARWRRWHTTTVVLAAGGATRPPSRTSYWCVSRRTPAPDGGELIALRFDDLDDRTLRIERAISGREVGPTESRRPRTLTVGASTARLWRTLERDWTERAGRTAGPWLFARDELHEQPLLSGTLNHRFSRLSDQAGTAGATLHRLRHSVATFLVARGQILQAQARLGHRDAATTLREYSYALPLTDRNVANAIDAHIDQPATTDAARRPHEASDPAFCRATDGV